MAATKTVTQSWRVRNLGNTSPPQHASNVHFHRLFAQASGIVVLFGYGIQVRIDRGHLLLEDGIGPERRHGRFPRVHHGLRRVVVIGAEGMVSLAALEWLSDQNISFVMLERDGSVLLTTSPVFPSDARLRRAQGCAQHSEAAVLISREIIRRKIVGQERLVREKLKNESLADQIARCGDMLPSANSVDAIRQVEGLASYA